MKRKNNCRNVSISLLILMVSVTGGCAGKNTIHEHDHQAAYQAYQAGDYELAAERFERLVEAAPKDPELWFRLGNAHAKAKHPQEAVNAYENALLRDPELAKAWYNMGLVQLQTALKTFVEMEKYVPADSSVGRQGKELQAKIFTLLEERSAGNENEE